MRQIRQSCSITSQTDGKSSKRNRNPTLAEISTISGQTRSQFMIRFRIVLPFIQGQLGRSHGLADFLLILYESQKALHPKYPGAYRRKQRSCAPMWITNDQADTKKMGCSILEGQTQRIKQVALPTMVNSSRIATKILSVPLREYLTFSICMIFAIVFIIGMQCIMSVVYHECSVS